MPGSIPRHDLPQGNARAKRLVAMAEEQAMEVAATLMAENEADIALMREIGARMRLRPLPVIAEDDADIKLLYAIKERMERRVRRIAKQRNVIREISRVAA